MQDDPTDNKKESKQNDQKIQIDRIFNIAEYPVMEFISKFINDSPSSIFIDNSVKYKEPLILLPFKEYDINKYIQFNLVIDLRSKIVQKIPIDSIIKHKPVRDGIGFLWHCVREVFESIISSNLINKKNMENITIELDEKNWFFYPKYTNHLSTKKIELENVIHKIDYVNNNLNKFTPDESIKINNEFKNAINQLEILNIQINKEILDDDQKINESFLHRHIIYIQMDEILEADLPKHNLKV